MEEVPNWVCVFVHRNNDFSTRNTWMISKWLEESRIGVPCGRNRKRWSNLEIQHHFLIKYTWDVLHMKASRKKLSSQKQSRGPTIWKDMRKNAWKDIANWRRKRQRQLYTVSTPCLDDHNFKEEELETVGDLAKVCSQIVFKKFVFGTNWRT